MTVGVGHKFFTHTPSENTRISWAGYYPTNGKVCVGYYVSRTSLESNEDHSDCHHYSGCSRARDKLIAGLAPGNSVRARHVRLDIMAALRNLVGVEITEYATLQAETREMATRRTVAQAESMGSDAVVSVRYTTSMITSGASEILAYGTGLKLS